MCTAIVRAEINTCRTFVIMPKEELTEDKPILIRMKENRIKSGKYQEKYPENLMNASSEPVRSRIIATKPTSCYGHRKAAKEILLSRI